MSSPCVKYDDPPTRHVVVLPLGIRIESLPLFDPHSKLIEIQSMMAALTPVLSSLAPIFTILDAVLAVVEFVKAVATLNPVKIAAALDKFVQLTDKLLGMIPQVSIPLMLVGILQLMIDLMDALVELLEELAEHQQQIQDMKAFAEREGLEDMVLSAICLEENLEVQLEFFNNALGAVAAFMAIVAVLGDFIGLDLSIDISVTPGSPIQDSIDRVSAIRDTLQTALEAIPLP